MFLSIKRLIVIHSSNLQLSSCVWLRWYFGSRIYKFSTNDISENNQLLRSESLSGMCAKLRTVAASNNRIHPTRSLYYCLFAPRIHGVVLRAHSVRGESTPAEWLQHNQNIYFAVYDWHSQNNDGVDFMSLVSKEDNTVKRIQSTGCTVCKIKERFYTAEVRNTENWLRNCVFCKVNFDFPLFVLWKFVSWVVRILQMFHGNISEFFHKNMFSSDLFKFQCKLAYV